MAHWSWWTKRQDHLRIRRYRLLNRDRWILRTDRKKSYLRSHLGNCRRRPTWRSVSTVDVKMGKRQEGPRDQDTNTFKFPGARAKINGRLSAPGNPRTLFQSNSTTPAQYSVIKRRSRLFLRPCTVLLSCRQDKSRNVTRLQCAMTATCQSRSTPKLKSSCEHGV